MLAVSDWELATHILKRPGMCCGWEPTFREVLALLRGVALGRYPWHGSGFLAGFDDFVRARFDGPMCGTEYHLLKAFGDLPCREACDAVLALLHEWKVSTGENGESEPLIVPRP